jgi:sec-independent protein translocase protein TatB
MFPEGRAAEFLIVAMVALIVVGPKDLPALLRKLGQFMGKLRSMAAEFRSSFDEMARQSELDELRKEVEAMRAGQNLGLEDTHAALTESYDAVHHGLGGEAAHIYTPPSTAAEETATAPLVEEAKPRARKAATTMKIVDKAPAKPRAKAASKPAADPAAKSTAKPRAKKRGTDI